MSGRLDTVRSAHSRSLGSLDYNENARYLHINWFLEALVNVMIYLKKIAFSIGIYAYVCMYNNGSEYISCTVRKQCRENASRLSQSR